MALNRLTTVFWFELNCLVCYNHSDWSIKVITSIYHIIKYLWHGVTRIWPVIWILQISYTTTYQYRGPTRDVILIRLHHYAPAEYVNSYSETIIGSWWGSLFHSCSIWLLLIRTVSLKHSRHLVMALLNHLLW